MISGSSMTNSSRKPASGSLASSCLAKSGSAEKLMSLSPGRRSRTEQETSSLGQIKTGTISCPAPIVCVFPFPKEYHMANPFVHVELHTRDLAKAKAFYSKLFGWKLEDMPMPGGGSYTMISVGEGTAGGMMTEAN